MANTTSGLVVGKIIPVRAYDQDEKAHRRLLAEGVNHVAAAAYTPETQLAARVDDKDLTSDWVTMDIDVVVTPFIPVRAHVLVFFYYINNGVLDLNAEMRVVRNGDVQQSIVLPVLPQDHHYMTFPLQLLQDLEPNTTYTYSVEAKEGLGEGAEDGACLDPTSMSVRIEHRRLPQ